MTDTDQDENPPRTAFDVQRDFLLLLNRRGIYNPPGNAEKAKRRAKNKVAKRSRKRNR